MKHLVIVESPTKAKTISKFLGKDYRVESSFGHIRDLPKREMGVDIEHDFEPKYVIPKTSAKRAGELKKLAKKAEDVYFATDEDREGEAISWHLQQILKVPSSKAKRIAFHEITKGAIMDALEHPREIKQHLVDAQQARRILDRLVGYELSPFLWRKIARGLSAGRVQSVAVRLIVEREREIQAFKEQEYWTIELEATHKKDPEIISAKLHSKDGKSLDKFAIGNEKDAKKILADLKGVTYEIVDVTRKDTKKKAPAPFTTSTLQQDANRRLRFSPKQTMMLAQQLYEGIEAGHEEAGGYITYMRTDSTNLSEVFVTEAQEYLLNEYGKEYAGKSKKHATKSKLAQEAHEAIRPTSLARTPAMVKGHLSDRQYKLYDLIWRRALASQMPDAIYEAATMDIAAQKKDIPSYHFRATGQVEKFPGFTAVYSISSEQVVIPSLSKGDILDEKKLEPVQHFTKPPARYSEAGLVKVLEENGIGRPSTYAPTISTVVDRGYVEKEERRLKPTDMAFLVTDLLVNHFPEIVDYKFTAEMEDDLDKVAHGKKEWVPLLRAFYKPFKKNLMEKDKELSKKELTQEETDEKCEKCGKPMVIKVGRFGKFLACTGFPDCKNTKEYLSPGEEKEEQEAMENVEPCEKCGSEMVIKHGRFGKFLACSKYPDCKNIRSLTDKKIDMKCPKCSEGDVIQKKTRRGKMFFGCSKYPDCDYASWTNPKEEEGAEK